MLCDHRPARLRANRFTLEDKGVERSHREGLTVCLLEREQDRHR